MQNPEFELLLVGAMLHRPELVEAVDLVPDMFTSTLYREAFIAIQELHRSREAIDIFSLAQSLDRSSTHDGWLAVLAKAMNECYSPSNGMTYAGHIRQAHQIRATKDIATALIQDVETGGVEAIDAAVKELLQLGMSQRNYEMSVRTALTQAVDRIDEIFHLDGKLAGITSGLSGIDEKLGGFHNSDLVVVAARPAMGKTAMLLNFALSAGVPCGIISSEQPGQQVGTRFIAMEGRINANKLRNANLLDEDWPKMTRAVSNLQNKPIRINDRAGISISQLVRQARAWKHHHDIKALYVDYIQRIKATDQRAKTHEQVGEVVTTLKDLARDLDIPVIALAQVNREVEKRNNKRPGMGDIKDSGTIEQEADVVACLYRDDAYNDESPDKGTAEVDIVKNRHGPTGFVRVVWLAQYMRFMDFTPQQEDYSRGDYHYGA